jgi:hypothetical protein
MSDQKGWPDSNRPWIPMNPGQQGPHVIMDKSGIRRWAWWTPISDRLGGAWMSGGGGSAYLDWTYIGPGKSPDGLPVY